MSMPAERLNTGVDLGRLLEGLAAAPAVPVTAITDDSRRVSAGGLFVACQGVTHHGLDFAADAAAAGAAAVLWDKTTGDPRVAHGDIPFVAVDGLAGLLGEIANRFYGFPSHAVDTVGVTGTNGKTTVAFLVAQCLQRLGHACGYIGTLGFGVDDLSVDLGLTTPPCLDLHAKLADFRGAGATHAAIEVSSHALAQDRVDGMRFDAAIFTNLSRDHVDYHGDMRAYGETKARLFTDYESAHRIVNVDCEFGRTIAERCADAIVTSTQEGSVPGGQRYVFAHSVATSTGSRVELESSWGAGEVEIPLPGEFNVANATQVIAYLLAKGVDFADVLEVSSGMAAPPGRMQSVVVQGADDLPAVFVDYSHTPAALEAALQALRPHARGALWCVFGCGGDRDRGKRPEMGAIASRFADRAVVTNDNPRNEPPERIIGEILAGMDADACAIESRDAAIAWAIREADASDTILIAGKGHEDYQLIGDERLDFSDYQTARAQLEARRGGERDDG